MSTTLTTEELGSLPILNRNVTQMLLVTPGAQLHSDWQHSQAENPQGGYQIDVNGQQFTSNGFLLDGTENNSAILGIAIVNPNIDSLQEFKVTTSDYDAEFGSVAGALMQATTKSGTNQYHGSLSNIFGTISSTLTTGSRELTCRCAGISLADRLAVQSSRINCFSLLIIKGLRRRRDASVTTTVPTAAERTGDLTALLGDFICSDGSTSPTGCGANALMVPTTESGTIAAQAGMVFDPNSGDIDPNSLSRNGNNRSAITTNGQPNMLSVGPALTNIMNFLPAPNVPGAGIS